MARVSVIIPVYNTKEYLARCVDSVLNQTFGDISVILVDDGSTDGSALVCDSYAKDIRIKVIHKENGGLSSARNSGIAMAESEYICFVDSDDYLPKNAIERLMSEADKNTDVVICGYFLDYGTKLKENYAKGGNYNIDNIGDAFAELKAKHIFDPAWNKLIRLEFLKENNILFKEGELYEDTEFNINILKSKSNIKVISDCLYYYVQRQGSITKRFNPEKLETLKSRALDLIDLSLMFNNKQAYAYCNYFYIKYLFSSFINFNFKGSNLSKSQIKAIIKAEIEDPVFLKTINEAKGISRMENAVILIAKTKNVNIIYWFSKILFKVR